MRLLFVCGGTGGHINPAIAVANYAKTQDPNVKILFAGNPKGMEAQLVPKAGFDFAPIKVKGFQRKLSWYNLKNNCQAVFYLMGASHRAREILRGFSPDVVVGTGGYASGALLRRAAKDGYPTLTHEQNAFPGVTTKLLSRYVNKVLLAVPEAKEYLPECQTVVTGNPVREEILFASRQQARQELGIEENQVCILSFGGSNGAKKLNDAMAQVLALNRENRDVVHIHGTGSYDWERFGALLREQGVDLQNYPNLRVREYIDDMSRCMAAADLLITRSGALTLCEIQAAGKAAILIPSPNVAANHQYYNAKVLVDEGAALMLQEKDLTGQALFEQVRELLEHPGRLKELSHNALATAIVDANARIYSEICKLARENREK